jgi:sortase A
MRGRLTQGLLPPSTRRVLQVGLNVFASASLALGLLCSTVYVLARADQRVGNDAALEAFDRARQIALAREPNQDQWSGQRRAEYRESLLEPLDAPPGVLTIPSIDLTVPIFVGTSDLALNRGVGWIEGTAAPGVPGNLGLAGHRDGYFRGVKDLKVDDLIEVQTVDRTVRYRVSEILIVEPSDVFVLEPTDEPSITLVTCYPFYFVGHAPQRYVVKGHLDPPST